jgi:carbonic anhydrase
MALATSQIQRGKKPDLGQILAADLPASLVVFLVALPLSLGIALASGAPLMAGVIAAIVGGVVVGIFGGAPMQVSGPAAGLTVIVFGFIHQFGWQVTCAITVAAGILQIVFGAMGIAPLTMAVSPAVIHGMLAAIGILIALSQIHVVLGLAPAGKGLANLEAIPASIMNMNPSAALLGIGTIVILALWPKIRNTRLRKLPAALVGVVGMTLVSVVLGMKVPTVEFTGGLLESIALPVLPTENLPAIIGAVLALTLVASAESLLCAVATDKLHNGPRANLDRELVAQGAGNTLSGLLGGLPITGVIVRSTANIAAGGKTRLSAILHGVWMLVFVALLPGLVMMVPLAVLAGLLVHTGFRLVNVNHIRELRKYQEVGVYAITVLGIVGINLLAGLAIGFAVAILRLLWKLNHVDVAIKQRDERWQVTIQGTLSFAGIPKLTRTLAAIPPGAEVDVHLALRYLDHAGYEALHSWQTTYEKLGGRVHVAALEELWAKDRPAMETPMVSSQTFEDVWAKNNVGAGNGGALVEAAATTTASLKREQP